MKYLVYKEFGPDYDSYFDYVDSVQKRMPAGLFAFASNTDNYDLRNPNSLHDSWLEQLTISEVPHATEEKMRAVHISARFKGPNHDRYIVLEYGGVREYRASNSGRHGAPAQTPHGDVLVHEILVVQDELFSHEFVFSREASLFIEFATFEHRVEIVQDKR